MTHRIAVAATVEDARANSYRNHLRQIFPDAGLAHVSVVQLYTVDADLTKEQLALAAERLTNPLIEKSSTGFIPAPEQYAYAIEVGFLPGVTDNVGKTARETIEDTIGRKFTDAEGVYSSYVIFLTGTIAEQAAYAFARELHNPLIERASVRGAEAGDFPIVVPKVHLGAAPGTDEVNLEVSDDELTRLGKEGIANKDGSRRGPLALSLKAMKTIRDHFRTLKRNPTDVELEALAQTWSEHCKHTIFADPLDEVKEGIYRRYIKGATEKIRKAKGKKDFCVSVFKDNSGAIAFDKDYLVTHKVETHNSPSGLDPFGGSVTAIVGVNRDALGFGLGAKPIANTYGFCVADPHDERALYRDKERSQPLLPARRILEGVVRGVNAGGNQSGIPTPLGFVAVDQSYRGKPLVYGGTVGLIPRKHKGKKLYEKKARPGDYIVMLGGRVGLDGIHGATFSSESLNKGSPATAVQIGDPITQKKFLDALIREARDKGLYSSITDDGAGGLSGSVGEMSREAGGCDVQLENVPLKYPGLAPWQIWLSESQERMTLAVPKAKWNAFKKIMDRHDVEATRIGTFTRSGKCTVSYKEKKVMELSLAFLHDGRPVERQVGEAVHIPPGERPDPRADLPSALLELFARPNIGSTSFIAQQYDHEVQGASVTKPVQGRGRVNADAAVLQPLPHSTRGIVLSHGLTPWYSQLDTYDMAAASIDTAIRSAICAGASREYLAILDNFCWSSSQKPERLYQLKRAAKACYDYAVAYKTPFISGKDSMFNDFRGYTQDGSDIQVSALPTLLVSALGVIEDVRAAVTLDWKRVGDLVYVVGETHDELGGSEYYAMSGHVGSGVPKVLAKKNAKAYDALSRAIGKGLVASALSVGRGGLAAALGKASVAGRLGADIDLSNLAGSAKTAEAKLFSESQGRMLVTVRPAVQRDFEKHFKNVPLTMLGEVVQAATLTLVLPEQRIELPLSAITEAYRSFFKHW